MSNNTGQDRDQDQEMPPLPPAKHSHLPPASSSGLTSLLGGVGPADSEEEAPPGRSQAEQCTTKEELVTSEKEVVAPGGRIDADVHADRMEDIQVSLEHELRDPASWTLYTSPEGYPYYYNHISGQSVWAPYNYESGQNISEYSSNTMSRENSVWTEAEGRRVARESDNDIDGESGRLVDDDRYAIPEGFVFEDGADRFAEEAGGADDDDDVDEYNADGGVEGTSRSAEDDDVDEEAFLAYLNSPEGQLALEEEKRLIEEQASQLLKQRLKEGMKIADKSVWGQMKLKDDSQYHQGYDENKHIYPTSGYSSQRRGGLGGSEDYNLHRRHAPNMHQQSQPQRPATSLSRRQYPTPYQEYDQSNYLTEPLSPTYQEGVRKGPFSSSRRPHRRRGVVDLEGGKTEGDSDNDADLSSSDSDVEEIIAPTIPDIPASQVLSTVLAPVQTALGQLLGVGTYYTQQLLSRISTGGGIDVGALSQQALDVSSHVIDKSIEIFQYYGVPIYVSINESVVQFIESNLSNLSAASTSPEFMTNSVSIPATVSASEVPATTTAARARAPSEASPPLELPREAAPSYIVREVNAALLGDNDTLVNNLGASV